MTPINWGIPGIYPLGFYPSGFYLKKRKV